MHHEDFKEDLRKFRLKSRTWAGERSKRDMYSRLKKLWAPPHPHKLPLKHTASPWTDSVQIPHKAWSLTPPTVNFILFFFFLKIMPAERGFYKVPKFHLTLAKLVIYANVRGRDVKWTLDLKNLLRWSESMWSFLKTTWTYCSFYLFSFLLCWYKRNKSLPDCNNTTKPHCHIGSLSFSLLTGCFFYFAFVMSCFIEALKYLEMVRCFVLIIFLYIYI